MHWQNPLKQSDQHAASLQTSLEWLNSFPKPEAAYRARMLQIAQEDSDAAPSKLGLVRIAFEGNCRISAKVDKGAVTVTAVLMREDA